ncbi:hypothetical protein C5167_028859 [Papaver somniferum]|uniref:phenylalanine N-monooxygenase-like n=1 Tax=Papaver somniferum TaxID=3469 RepID=UPI000E6F9B4C|nr:phenylalanine N-monooxygenase-like [Papaver somniferum]RZC91027.1 hypothetical protein C5167_028859 [Papaver somniferum]
MANKTSFLTFSNTTLWLDSASTLSIVELNTSYLLTILASIVVLLLINFGVNTLKKQPSLPASFPLPPGPSPWPILGSIPTLLRNKPRYKWILGLMKEMNTEIACIHLGNVHIIPVTSPELAREFLQKQDAVFASRPRTMATEHLSRGFLTTSVTPWGDQWKKMRSVVTSEMVSHARLEWLLGKRNEEANNLVFYLHNMCSTNSLSGGEVFNLRLLTRQFSGNVIRKMIFNKRYFGKGREDGGPGIEEIEHVDAAFEVLKYIYAFGIQDYLPYLRWLDLDGHENIIRKAMGVVNKYHDPIIEERIRQWSNGSTKNKVPEDLLDVLISLKDKQGKPLLSAEEIKAQAVELIIATVDNPANTVEWAMAEMINQPDILIKATEEIDMVVGKSRWVQESDFPKLNYVKACVREALRLHPVTPFNVPHVSNSDTIVSGYFIPKGSHVLLSRTGLGRNPRIWHKPLNFNPERHLMSKDDGVANVDLTERGLRFISFTIGRRGCVGGALGTAITIMLLARLIQGFEWSAPPGESINLSESANDLFLAKPLFAHAKPRLPLHIYPAE